jgi:predicted amino acid dehydrogenase
VKQIISISLGPAEDDYQIDTRFLDQRFSIQRLGTDGDYDRARELLLQWNKKADAIGIGGIQFPYEIGSRKTPDRAAAELLELAEQLHTPVTTGDILRGVSHEWALRHTQFVFGNNYFDNARVLFLSGRTNARLARVMGEFTDNLQFADPVLEEGLPRLITSARELSLYTGSVRDALRWVPGRRLVSDAAPVRKAAEYLLHTAVKKASVLVVPYYRFFQYLEPFSSEELEGKTIITTTAYDDRISYLAERGVATIIDTTPKIFERVVGVSVLEALFLAARDLGAKENRNDELLEIISEMEMSPNITYPQGEKYRVNRFAFIVYPLEQDYLKKIKPVEVLSEILPRSLGTVEKLAAYAPPFVYSKVTGIQSKTGVRSEGWLIALSETPEQMQAHSPGFTTRRLLQAAKLARNLGAQIMGIGMFPKSIRDVSTEVAHRAVLPITTGNSYVASVALWAAAEVVRRMGLVQLKNGKILRANTLVIGATGAVGTICSRLLATAFESVTMVSRNMARLLALQESIAEETGDVDLHVSTRADTHLKDMDVIIAASGGAGNVLDIMQVKPGCVIVDINLPTIFTREMVVRRPDVVVIRSGHIKLPGGRIDMKDIGLPPDIVYPGMAETIVLALEGRFENFTVGTDTQWDRVREIYRLGLKHGMELAAISGIDGVLSDEDIERVKKLAIKERAAG